MINRELRPAFLLTFDDSIDEYGQKHQSVPTKRNIELTLRLYQHTNVEDPRYNDVTHISLTLDKNITDANSIEIDGVKYLIMFINPEGRYTQLFLKKE